MKNKINLIFVVLVILLSACSSSANTTNAASSANQGQGIPGNSSSGGSAPVNYSKNVLPIFTSSCFGCHSGAKISRGLDLSTYSTLMAGSQNGPVVVPGKANESLLVQMIETGRMPKNGPPLSVDQIKIIVDWINSGAENN